MSSAKEVVDSIMSGETAKAEEIVDSVLRQKIMDRIDDIKADVLQNPYEPVANKE